MSRWSLRRKGTTGHGRAPEPTGAAAFAVEEYDGIVLLRSSTDDSLTSADIGDLARSLASDDGTVTVVTGAEEEAADALWPRLATLLDSLRDENVTSVRLVMSGAGDDRPGREAPARRIAEAWGLEVIAPDAVVLVVPGGGLFVPGVRPDSRTWCGWWRFAPGEEPVALGPRQPSPAWQAGPPVRTESTAGGCVVEQIPAGLLVRPKDALAPRLGDLCYAIPVDRSGPLILVGVPDGEDVLPADVAEAAGSLPSSARSRIRIAPGGRSDVLEAGRSLAGTLGHDVVVHTGLPLLPTGGLTDRYAVRATIADADGVPRWHPYVDAVVCPPGEDPRLLRWSSPVPGRGRGEQGVLPLSDRWQAAVTRAGLWISGPDGDPVPVAGRPVAADGPVIEVGRAGEPLDASLWPELSRLLDALGADVCARARLMVHGTCVDGGQALRGLAGRHHLRSLRFGTLPVPGAGRAGRSTAAAVPAPAASAGSAVTHGARPARGLTSGPAPSGAATPARVATPARTPASAPGSAPVFASASGSAPGASPVSASTASTAASGPVPAPAPARALAPAARPRGAGPRIPLAQLLEPDAGPEPATVSGSPAPASPAPAPRRAPGPATATAEGPRAVTGPAPGEPGPTRSSGPAEEPGVTAPLGETTAPAAAAPVPAPSTPEPSEPSAAPARVIATSSDPDPGPVPAPPAASGAVRGAEAFAPAPFLPGYSSTEEERAAFRELAASEWERHGAAVARMLTRMPALRGREQEAARADLIALRLYLRVTEGPLSHGALHHALGTGDRKLLPYAACVASGLRRLPAFRGAVVRGARPGETPAAGSLLRDAGPVSALPADGAQPAPGGARYLVSSVTGRRIRQLLDGSADDVRADEVVFPPGTVFRVLDVRPDSGSPASPLVLLRELPGIPPASASGGAPLDDQDDAALARLDAALSGGTAAAATGPWPVRCAGPVGLPHSNGKSD
ncbi:hypothetical protein AB0P41_07975 [Streptomyces sp. NPDC079167]|uniref:hypothetical protein n=1 Tax=Streptomyces sp. NPDC079167 TaxID=3154513 RepID=UPI00343F9396